MTTPDESPVSAAPVPKYRYFTAPPEIVHLKVEDLTAFLPEGAWIGRPSDKQREVAVPTAKILETNYPRIDFSRLCDLLPGCIERIADAPEWVALPADRVALAYKIGSRRELIPEPPAEKKIEEKSSVDAPAAIEPKPPVDTPDAAAIPAWKRLPKPVLAPIPQPEPAAEAKSVEAPKPPPIFGELPVPSETALKDVFGAEVFLSVRRLVEWCGSQPGVKGCVLTRGADVVKFGDHLQALQTQGVSGEVFHAVRKIAAASGLKLPQALTIYTDSGPASLLRHQGMVLAVLHSTGGLTAEMRAKYKMILQAIERAATPKS